MDFPRIDEGGRIGPADASVTPRYAGPPTFALLPTAAEVGDLDVAVVGVPFDTGVSFRPGARFGPEHIRASSRLLRPYNPAADVSPFARLQVADCGDIAANPFSIEEAVAQVERGADALTERAGRLLTLGGDHTIALPLLRSLARRHGPVAVVHFDAHLEVYTPTEIIRVDYDTPYVRHLPTRLTRIGPVTNAGVSVQTMFPTRNDSFVAEWRAFHRNVTEKKRPKTTLEDARNDMVLARDMAAKME